MTSQARIDATAFGRVLLELMEARGIPPIREEIVALGERAGIEGLALAERAADAEAGYSGYLDGLDDELCLDEREMVRLAVAYTIEEYWDPAGQHCAFG